MQHKIAIIQKFITHYRRPFFELLKERLAKSDIELVLVYGNPRSKDGDNKDAVSISWGKNVKSRSLNVFGHELLFLSAFRFLRGADLVIVEQASKLTLNYLLFLAQQAGLKKFCLWGHGKNFDVHSASRVGEMLKFFMSRYVHWWFAYNDFSAAVVKSLGYPENRITSVQNSIDTRSLIKAQESITQENLECIRRETGLKSRNVCIYSGAMYSERRLDYLIKACQEVKRQIRDFEMIFIGEGVDQEKVEIAAKQFDWIHYVGAKFGKGKVPYFMLSKLLLIPSSVGLAVLDSISLETPLITTHRIGHGPEIDYIRNGLNGVIVRDFNDFIKYASCISYLLKNDDALNKLIAGCKMGKENYTIEEMVDRFVKGVFNALRV
jgi:glycosyltransferase involved in cell wall biosynthesis